MKSRTIRKFTVRNYGILINRIIDRYNWGVIDSDTNEPRFKYTTECLVRRFREHTAYPLKITEKYYKLHLQGDYHFYTTAIRSTMCLLMIDIDAHEGQEDAREVAYWIEAYFHKGAYIEPSRNRLGMHLYFIVAIGEDTNGKINYPQRRLLNSLIDTYTKRLAELIASEGFASNICGIKGAYSEGKYINNEFKYLSRGNLAKLPCPQNQEAFDQFKNIPIQTISDIEQNIKVIEELCCECKQFKLDTDVAGSSDAETQNSDTTAQTGSQDQYSYKYLVYTHVDNDQKCIEKMYDTSAFIRCVCSVAMLARKLKHIPSYEEWLNFYVQNGWNNSSPDKDRTKRFNKVCKFVEKSFNPAFTNKTIYTIGEYIAGIKALISEQELQEIAVKTGMRKNALKYEDLDIAMGHHLLQALKKKPFPYELTSPQVSMIEYFKSLKAKGSYDRSCNFNKVIACRKALVKIGYIERLNKDYIFKVGGKKGKGISEKWGIGINCPRYTDYKRLVPQDVIDRAIKFDSKDINKSKPSHAHCVDWKWVG